MRTLSLLRLVHFIGFLFLCLALSGQVDTSKGKDLSIQTNTTAVPATSFWAGSKLAYNFEEEGADNLIGSGQVRLESINRFKENARFDLLIVGNIAKITSSTGENPADDISELVQSDQGLSIGITPVYELARWNTKSIDDIDLLSLYGNISYKINGFQDVGSNDETISLEQFRSSVGLSFEGLQVTSGAPIMMSTEFIYSTFSKEKYQAVFNQSVSHFIAIETELILPLSNQMGFLLSYNLSNRSGGVFQAGIVMRSNSNMQSL